MNDLNTPRGQHVKPNCRDVGDPFNWLLKRIVAAIALAMFLLLIGFFLLLEMKIIHRHDDPKLMISVFNIGKTYESFEIHTAA